MAELPEKPSKLDILKFIANNWAQTGAHAAATPYHMMDALVNKTPVMGPGGQVNPNIVDQSAEVGKSMLLTGAAKTAAEAAGSQLFGAGTELGVFSGKRGTKPTFWTEYKIDRLRALDKRLEGQSDKAKFAEFKALNPEYKQTYDYFRSTLNRMRDADKGGGTSLGSNFGNRPPPKLGPDNPGETMSWLWRQQPVTPKWVENWGKEAGVPVTNKMQGDTNYIQMKSNISNKPVEVRIPGDEHWGRARTSGEVGRVFDTGTSIGENWGGRVEPKLTEKYAPGLINQSGGSYAHPEHLEKALELATGASRGPGGFKLVSPDYGPYSIPKGDAFATPKAKQDPKQLKLLSGGYTPADILQILKQQQVVNGQET